MIKFSNLSQALIKLSTHLYKDSVTSSDHLSSRGENVNALIDILEENVFLYVIGVPFMKKIFAADFSLLNGFNANVPARQEYKRCLLTTVRFFLAKDAVLRPRKQRAQQELR